MGHRFYFTQLKNFCMTPPQYPGSQVANRIPTEFYLKLMFIYFLLEFLADFDCHHGDWSRRPFQFNLNLIAWFYSVLDLPDCQASPTNSLHSHMLANDSPAPCCPCIWDLNSGHVTMEKGRLLTDTDYWYLPFCILYSTRTEGSSQNWAVGGRTTNFWAVMQSTLKLMSKTHISGNSVREKCPLV